MRTLQRIALVLVIIGALNWGLIGLFQWDLVASLFGGQDAFLSRVVYTLVGLSGLACLSLLFDPVDEDVRNPNSSAKSRNVSYGTEFSEEADINPLGESNQDNMGQNRRHPSEENK